MSEEEFLELMGKGTKDEDPKLIEALEKAMKEHEEIKHTETEEKMAHWFEEDPDSAWLGLMTTILAANHPGSSLEHYGIEGQKWGVKNGPPYPLERQKGFRRISKKDKAKILMDNLDDLSLQEIRDLVSRMELEEKLANWANPPKPESFISKMLKESGKTILAAAVPAATTYAFKKIVAQTMGDDVVSEMFPSKKK